MDVYKIDNCDIDGYVCHFRQEDKYSTVSGFVTCRNGAYSAFISKKSSFNEYNIKESAINEAKKAFKLA